MGAGPRAEVASSHLVRFYEHDEELVQAVARFAGSSLGAGDSVVAIATGEHLAEVEKRLAANGLDVAGARARGRYVPLEAERTLREILHDGRPDREHFARVVGGAIRTAAAAGGSAPVRAYGEMAALLWSDARLDDAIALEELWNDLARELSFSVVCAHSLHGFAGEESAMARICETHSAIAPGSTGEDPAERLATIATLQRRASLLEEALAQTRAAAESLSRLAAIVECSDDAIIGKTLDGIVTSWNAGAERTFGYRADEMIGQPIARLMPPDRAEDVRAILDTIRSGERVDHYETERIRKDGRRIRVSISVSPILDAQGRVTGASKIARDVTARRRLEAQREHLLGVAQRARAEAEAASRSKDEFLAMLSHELRNPLAALRNAVFSARLDPERRERALEIASRQTEQLARLVDDLLDLSRITQGRVRLNQQRVSLGEIAERALEAARPLLEERGHRLAVALPEAPVHVDGDPTRLEQVMANLLANAARYTDPGGRVELRLERAGHEAVLRVRDDGIGIAPDLLPRIFELFVQGGRPQERAAGGLGIGLAVVRELVRLHGGRVEAHSEGPGRGAEFVVRLPAAAEARGEERDPAAEGDPPAWAALDVLVVEDNVDAAEGLLMLLEVFGHRVRVAHDGPSGIEAARARVPDVMLVDIGLPGLDGYEVARRLRQAAETREVTLVALTGFGQEEDRRRALEAGFDHHLTKPVDPARLRALIAGIAGPR